MFGSLILPTGVTCGVGIHHHHNLSASMGSTPYYYYHPTIMSFPSRSKLLLLLLPRTRMIRASSSSSSSSSSFTAPPDTVQPSTTLNLYQILRIKHNASSLEIKSAYRKLAKQFHPDALPSSSDDSDGAGLDFMAIHNAYATLSDPTERARYDLSIHIQTTRNHTRFNSYSSSSSSSVDGNENRRRRSYGMPTRRWETDQCW